MRQIEIGLNSQGGCLTGTRFRGAYDSQATVKNYRLITILPTLDKLLEKLLGKQYFTEYMDPKLSNSLTAYQKNNWNNTTLLRLVEKWTMDLDSRQVVGVLSSDMSKAFDSVSPPLLIKTLESYNFSGSALNNLNSALVFLSQTKQGQARFCDQSLEKHNEVVLRGLHLVPFCGTHFKMISLIYMRRKFLCMPTDDHQMFVSV